MTPEEFDARLRLIDAAYKLDLVKAELLPGLHPRTLQRKRRDAIRDTIQAIVAGLSDMEMNAILKVPLDTTTLSKIIYRTAADILIRELEGRVMGYRHEPKQRTAWDWVTESTC
jgi:hypothetical protein